MGAPTGPGWCFCGGGACPGWAAYTAHHRDWTGTGPDGASVRRDRVVTAFLRALASRYHELGMPVPTGTALELLELERSAGAAPESATGITPPPPEKPR